MPRLRLAHDAGWVAPGCRSCSAGATVRAVRARQERTRHLQLRVPTRPRRSDARPRDRADGSPAASEDPCPQRLRFLSSATTTYNADYHAEFDDGTQRPMLTVFDRDEDAIRPTHGHQRAPQPGRHAGTSAPSPRLPATGSRRRVRSSKLAAAPAEGLHGLRRTRPQPSPRPGRPDVRPSQVVPLVGTRTHAREHRRRSLIDDRGVDTPG
jgi:hypothetical protein